MLFALDDVLELDVRYFTKFGVFYISAFTIYMHLDENIKRRGAHGLWNASFLPSSPSLFCAAGFLSLLSQLRLLSFLSTYLLFSISQHYQKVSPEIVLSFGLAAGDFVICHQLAYKLS